MYTVSRRITTPSLEIPPIEVFGKIRVESNGPLSSPVQAVRVDATMIFPFGSTALRTILVGNAYRVQLELLSVRVEILLLRLLPITSRCRVKEFAMSRS